MPIDYSGFAIPKGVPRVVDRIKQKKDREQQERDCRRAVKKRDHGRCIVPGCRDAAVHLHHILYRSKGGKWTTNNVCSLCVNHHQMVHSALITIEGNADDHLTIHGDTKLLRFTL